MSPSPFLPLSAFFEKYFDHKVQKLSVNAGLTCPNRDGTLGRGGCTYCNNRSFNPDYCAPQESVAQQLERGKAFFRRAQDRRAARRSVTAEESSSLKYLAYFQAYTNTYGELSHLCRLYEEALSVDDVVGLVVGTRPDCMPSTLLDHLATLHRHAFVLVEYGVETTSDRTLRRINRGHDYRCAVEAIEATHAKGLPVGAHFILGLPGETREQILAQTTEINRLPLDTLKLHQLQIIRGTAMAHDFEAQQRRSAIDASFTSDYHLYSPQEYAALVVDFLERLRPDIVVERFTSSSPKELLLAPDWGMKNHEFVTLVRREFARRGTQQGFLHSSDIARSAISFTP